MNSQSNALWEGCFSSEVYGAAVKGLVSIILPRGLNPPWSCDMIIQYDGSYRNGAMIKIPLQVEKLESMSGVIHEAPFVMKGAVQHIIWTQLLEFKPKSIVNGNITGTYSSSTPGDRGTFELVRQDSKDPVLPMVAHTSSCCLF